MIEFPICDSAGGVMFKAQINASDDMSRSKKLGLAVEWAYLSSTDLIGANLIGANLMDADLRCADLRCADLMGADLMCADFTGARLRGADLRDADLTGARLRGADLRYADFTGARLRGADLMCARLRGANSLIDGGQDKRGFHFIAQKRDDGTMNVLAGCRYFESLAFARAHWGYAHSDDLALRAECLAKVNQFEAVAKARGWSYGSIKEKKDD